MLRPLLLKLAPRAKASGAIDFALRHNPIARGRAAASIDRYPHLSERGANDLTHSLIARILRAAEKTRYGKGRKGRLESWPVLTKQALHLAPQDFINPWIPFRIPAGSSGTSGVPLKLWRSLENVAAEQAFLDALLKPHGLTMRSRTAILRADSIKPPEETEPPYGRISHQDTRLTLSTPHLNAKTLPWYMRALESFSPSILFVYPSAVINLLTLMQQAKANLKIPVILTSSEILTDAAHDSLAEFFGARIVNYYGQAERACLAYATEPGKFYFHPCYGHVELTNPAPSGSDGENTVRIIATGYWNRAMPLIRYDTGDLLYVPAEYGIDEFLEIATGKRPFSGIAGREGEYVLTRDQMRIIGLNHIPREVKNIAQAQLVQTDYDTLLIRVIALPGFSEQDARRLREQARAKLPHSMTAIVEIAERLEMTPRGKTPFVIRNVT